ncbi:MAG: A/G-specific adenine glycosylase [Holophagae bacterium]|nr:MAG: A/G-specific adenine glycosylase [Holophagae bacterium]
MLGDDGDMTLAKRLLAWHRGNARQLPWRSEPRDPYRVLVSELMLQQTQVDRVLDRFEAFVAAYPDLATLAAATEEEVLAAWSGLGYYRRARMLHHLAREVRAGTGALPTSAAELAELPGVGPYTAAAVASLAFAEAIPVLDGNVLRVASRVLAFAGDPRTAAGREALLRWLRPLVEEGGPPGLVNEALMELGATVCRPTSPHCARCPLAPDCRARALGRPERYPPPRRRRAELAVTWVAACCVDAAGRWLVRQVTEGPILRGLWLPPIAALEPGASPEEVACDLVGGRLRAPPQPLASVRHSITHRRITVQPIRLALSSTRSASVTGRWVDPASPTVPTSSLFSKLIKVNNLSSQDAGE